MRRQRKILGKSWKDRRTNKDVLKELNTERELMDKVELLKLQYVGHVVRESVRQLALTVLEDTKVRATRPVIVGRQ